jgi:hypothetical protein
VKLENEALDFWSDSRELLIESDHKHIKEYRSMRLTVVASFGACRRN